MNFKTLWQNYPDDFDPCLSLSDNKPNFENQCAIRMGIALSRSKFKVKNKISMYDFSGERCWYHPESDNHILRVEELLKYFLKVFPKDVLTVRKKSFLEEISKDDFEGKEGIVIFQNFWGEGNQGDHVDLMNSEGELKTGEDDYFERSEKVYFWEID